METFRLVMEILNELIAAFCLYRATSVMLSKKCADTEAITWLFAAGLAHFWIKP